MALDFGFKSIYLRVKRGKNNPAPQSKSSMIKILSLLKIMFSGEKNVRKA